MDFVMLRRMGYMVYILDEVLVWLLMQKNIYYIWKTNQVTWMILINDTVLLYVPSSLVCLERVGLSNSSSPFSSSSFADVCSKN